MLMNTSGDPGKYKTLTSKDSVHLGSQTLLHATVLISPKILL